MAISYPLALPTAGRFRDIKWLPKTVVGVAQSPFTGQMQTYVWPGQWWEVEVSLPPMKDDAAGAWIAWRLALNGQQGTFQLADSIRTATRGTAAGAMQVGAGATALSTTLPLQNHTGSLAVADWVQVGNYLYRVTQVNSGTSVDVWPRLRASHAQGTSVVFTEAKGLFRMASNEEMNWSVDVAKFHGISFRACEAL